MIRQKILYIFFCIGQLEKFGPTKCSRWKSEGNSCFNEYAELIYAHRAPEPKRKVKGDQDVEYKLHEPEEEEDGY